MRRSRTGLRTNSTRSCLCASSSGWCVGLLPLAIRGSCERERIDAELTEQIRDIHPGLHGHPGVRRVWAELVTRGLRVGPKRVWRLMRAAGLRGRHPRAWRKTTITGQRPVEAPDLIGQEFTAA